MGAPTAWPLGDALHLSTAEKATASVTFDREFIESVKGINTHPVRLPNEVATSD